MSLSRLVRAKTIPLEMTPVSRFPSRATLTFACRSLLLLPVAQGYRWSMLVDGGWWIVLLPLPLALPSPSCL